MSTAVLSEAPYWPQDASALLANADCLLIQGYPIAREANRPFRLGSKIVHCEVDDQAVLASLLIAVRTFLSTIKGGAP